MLRNAPRLDYNLLDEPLLGLEDPGGLRCSVTLPGLLACLSNGAAVSLTGVQAYQQHPVHALLVQLAGLSLMRAGVDELQHDEDTWRRLLLGAAKQDGAGAEAFTLVVNDLAKPAFLQPPVPEGTLVGLKSEHERPSGELDVLITSKNHDLKMDRVDQPSIEHWVYGLVTLQTMQGFLGVGNYGIARMNGGFASRPCVAFAADHGAGARFLRDVRALLDARPALAEGFGLKGQLGLVWCAPWNGTTSLSFAELDPFFVEICRRIRLTQRADGSVVAYRGSSKKPRIDAKDSNGNTGDAWTPVSRKDQKALTMPESGFTYDRVQDLLFGAWSPGAAGKDRPGDRLWLGQVLVRGKGKTGGYHERWVPLSPKIRGLFARPDARTKLGERAKAWVEKARTARLTLLKPALLTLLQGGPASHKFDDERGEGYLRQLDAAIDNEFFALLFEHAEAPPQDADAAFETRLIALAKAQLDHARTSMPVPTARRRRAEARAYDLFEGVAHKHFKAAFAAIAAVPSVASGGSP